MATIQFGNYKVFGNEEPLSAVSYEASTTLGFDELIDSKTISEGRLNKWTTPLPDGKGGYHRNLESLYMRFRLHFGDKKSKWFVRGPEDQRTRDMTVLELDGSMNYYKEGDIIVEL